jgi:hypothetical protein
MEKIRDLIACYKENEDVMKKWLKKFVKNVEEI